MVTLQDNLTVTQIYDQSIITTLLREYDNEYLTPLSKRLPSLSSYAEKLAKYAKVISLQNPEGENVGFAAYYINNPEGGMAYLTQIVVKSKFRGCGAGSFLLQSFITDAKEHNFKLCKLEVNNNNIPAIKLYSKYGFETKDEASPESHYMELSLE